MILVELVAWAASLALLGAMLFLASVAFRSGEFAGRHEIVRPREQQNLDVQTGEASAELA